VTVAYFCNRSSYFLSRKKQSLAENIVLIDGFSSSGKSLVSAIFGYLERSEQWQMDDTCEHVSILNYLNEISNESAQGFILSKIDKLLYNLSIGRYVNFRKLDQSSPYFDGLEEKYKNRLLEKDTEKVIRKIKETKPILPIHLHFIFGYNNLLFDVFGDKLKLYLIVLRNPFYLIDRWHDGMWVNRICNNDREFNLCLKYEDEEIPWYTIDYASKYIKASEIEKSILTIFNFFTRVFDMYEKQTIYNKKKIMIVNFEDFISKPNFFVDNFCKILSTKRNDSFNQIMKKLTLPREQNENEINYKSFIEKYQISLSNEYIEILDKLNFRYESFKEKIKS